MKPIRSKTRWDAADPADGELGEWGAILAEWGAYLVIVENLWLGHWGSVRLKDVKVAHGMLGLTIHRTGTCPFRSVTTLWPPTIHRCKALISSHFHQKQLLPGDTG